MSLMTRLSFKTCNRGRQYCCTSNGNIITSVTVNMHLLFLSCTLYNISKCKVYALVNSVVTIMIDVTLNFTFIIGSKNFLYFILEYGLYQVHYIANCKIQHSESLREEHKFYLLCRHGFLHISLNGSYL